MRVWQQVNALFRHRLFSSFCRLFNVVVSFSSNFLFFCRSSVIATCKASKMQTNRFLDCKNVLYIVVHLVIFFISRYSNSKMPLEFMLSNHKRNMLLHDNFLYYRWSDNYWRCRLRSCGATVKTSGETTEGTVVSKSKAGHNHMEHSLAELECMRAITRLKQRAEEETSEKYQAAHDRERCCTDQQADEHVQGDVRGYSQAGSRHGLHNGTKAGPHRLRACGKGWLQVYFSKH